MRFKNKWAAQTTTVRTVKAGSTQLGSVFAYNPNSSVAYLQFFDKAASSDVTLNSTVPDEVFAVPPLSAISHPGQVNYTLGCQFACTTTATGNTAPSTGLDVSLRWN